MFLNNSFYIASHGATMNLLVWTSSVFFFFRVFYLSTQFISILTLKSSAIRWLICFRVSSRLFFVFFWMLWMLVTVYMCHVPYASQVSACRTIFTERRFSVSKKWIRSWSQAFLITFHKTFTIKFFDSSSRKYDE